MAAPSPSRPPSGDQPPHRDPAKLSGYAGVPCRSAQAAGSPREGRRHSQVHHQKSEGAGRQQDLDRVQHHQLGQRKLETAQSTGALSYIPYELAQEYGDIYTTQDQVEVAEQQAARDLIISVAPFINSGKGDPDPTGGQAESTKQKVEILRAN
jgi:hypothetical protein